MHEFSYIRMGTCVVQIMAAKMTITSHGVDSYATRVIDSINVNLV